MCKKYFLLAAILLATLLQPSKGNSQTTESETRQLLHKIDSALGNIKAVVYRIDYTNKFFARRDTVSTTAICSLYVDPKDKMKSFNSIDLEFEELKVRTYGYRRYDGKRSLWANSPVDSLDIELEADIESSKRVRESIVENYEHLLLREYLSQKQPFGKFEAAAGMIAISEEIFNGIPVYVLKLAFKDTEEIKENVENHYIRKSDFLPIAYYSSMNWENMNQYIYYEIEYLAINPYLPLDLFIIEKKESINARERHQILKNVITSKT